MNYTNLKSKCDRCVGRGVQLYAPTADSCVANIFENGITQLGAQHVVPLQ